MKETNKRTWERFILEKSADIKSAEQRHRRKINDVSAGGASMQGNVDEFNDGEIEIDIDDIGLFSASVVREWEDGFAVAFDINEDEKYSLQEDLEEFRHEHDLE